MGNTNIIFGPGGDDAVIGVEVNTFGYVVRAWNTNTQKDLVNTDYRPGELKRIVGASLARQLPARRWTKAGGRWNLVAVEFNEDVKPEEQDDPTIEIVAYINPRGYVISAHKNGDQPLTGSDYQDDERIEKARLASRSTPCCWDQDPSGNWKCYPCW